MSNEDSFISGFKGMTGAVLAAFVIFVVAPCAVCGGIATCGKVLEDADDKKTSSFPPDEPNNLIAPTRQQPNDG